MEIDLSYIDQMIDQMGIHDDTLGFMEEKMNEPFMTDEPPKKKIKTMKRSRKKTISQTNMTDAYMFLPVLNDSKKML